MYSKMPALLFIKAITHYYIKRTNARKHYIETHPKVLEEYMNNRIFTTSINKCLTEAETEEDARANCICPYDLSYEIGPLVEGKTYVIYIGHKGNESKVAEFEFRNSMSGVWEVEN